MIAGFTILESMKIKVLPKAAQIVIKRGQKTGPLQIRRGPFIRKYVPGQIKDAQAVFKLELHG